MAVPQATTPLFLVVLAQKSFHGRIHWLGDPGLGERVMHELTVFLETVVSRVHSGCDLLGSGCEINQPHVQRISWGEFRHWQNNAL